MPIRVRCSACKTEYNLADRLAGKKIRCKKCESLVTVPGPEDVVAGASRAKSSGVTKAKARPAAVRDQEDEPRPRRREAENEDDAPRKKKKSGKKKLPTGWIIGGSIGGVALIAGIILTIVMTRNKSDTSSKKEIGNTNPSRGNEDPSRPAEGKPAPKFPLGKETTFVTGPLDNEGYIDYEAALNDRLGKGITPETNANVLLWQALGPTSEGGQRMPAEYFKRLGVAEPPRDGAYFIGITAYSENDLKLDPDALAAINNQLSWASQRPWVAKDYPHIAAWLKANEKPLAVIVEATKRPHYYNPMIAHRTEKEPGWLLGALLPAVQKSRELSIALTTRAMLHVGEERFDEAWLDLLSCHRLGRLVARGASLIEGLVGIAIDNSASNADIPYLERAPLTSRQIQDHLKDLQNLPPMSSFADKVDLCERISHLEVLQLLRRYGFDGLDHLSGRTALDKLDAETEKALAMIDWEPALRNANLWFDRMVATMRVKDRTARMRGLDKIMEELKTLRSETGEPKKIAELIGKSNMPGKTIGKEIGNVFISRMMPATDKVQVAYDRLEQTQRNLQVAFALVAYHRDLDRYPEKLDELAPKYLTTIPGDLFSGKPLVYRPAEQGYLLYSVGVNGIDEEGRSFDDVPKGDDIGVRLPLPALKRK